MIRIAQFSFVSRQRMEADWHSALPGIPVPEQLKLPQRATAGSAGYDFFSPIDLELKPGESIFLPTGLRVRIDAGWVLLLLPRSGLGGKYRLQLNNTAGVIDSDYFDADNEGHIHLNLINDSRSGKILKVRAGEALIQGIFVPFGGTVDDAASVPRKGGFGSTDQRHTEEGKMKETTLVVMAAGMASRYGSAKQIAGMGPNGEILMEYSLMDAIRAGFDKVVFIIRPDMAEKMDEILGDRYKGRIGIEYAFQDFSSVPARIPEGRIKPFGTVHAVLCARDKVDGPFAVLNADDYYGLGAFGQMHAFLTGIRSAGKAAMMGYRLGNTVSKNGTVTRGICQTSGGELTGIKEIKKIASREDGTIVDQETAVMLDPRACVSMNFWGFGNDAFALMDDYFRRFLENIPEGDLKAECLLPVFADEMLRAGELSIRVIPTDSQWFGVTYPEDRSRVVEELKKLHEDGIYPY